MQGRDEEIQALQEEINNLLKEQERESQMLKEGQDPRDARITMLQLQVASLSEAIAQKKRDARNGGGSSSETLPDENFVDGEVQEEPEATQPGMKSLWTTFRTPKRTSVES